MGMGAIACGPTFLFCINPILIGSVLSKGLIMALWLLLEFSFGFTAAP